MSARGFSLIEMLVACALLVTIAGAGDISIQLLRRSSPAFLGLWVELLAEAEGG